ncbi:MAG TPA: hypothetical protein DD652_04985 [Lactobacillus sp.]|jgi:hypothetical protein|nr:hypothetical protein [Lactobacillus sp.]
MIGTWKLVSGKADAIDLTPSSSNPKDVQLVYEKEVQPGGDTGDEPGNEPSGHQVIKVLRLQANQTKINLTSQRRTTPRNLKRRNLTRRILQRRAQPSPIRLSKLKKPSKVRSHLSQLRKLLAGLLTMLHVQRACTEITLHLVKTCTETMLLHQKATMLRCLSQK